MGDHSGHPGSSGPKGGRTGAQTSKEGACPATAPGSGGKVNCQLEPTSTLATEAVAGRKSKHLGNSLLQLSASLQCPLWQSLMGTSWLGKLIFDKSRSLQESNEQRVNLKMRDNSSRTSAGQIRTRVQRRQSSQCTKRLIEGQNITTSMFQGLLA